MASTGQVKTLSAAERAQAFARLTRKQTTMLAPIAGTAGGRVSFEIPKVRLGQSVFIEVAAILNATHASSTSYAKAEFAPFTLIDHIKVSLNNGWNPVDLSGRSLYFWNLINSNAVSMGINTSAGRYAVQQPLVASSDGTDNIVRFLVEIPFMLNERDIIGLLMLQNQQTLVNVTIDLGSASDIAPAASGYTFVLSDIVITPMVTTFSLPADSRFFPDVSIIKITEERRHTIAGTGMQSLKIPCGNMYRKLLVYLEDSAGAILDSEISGNISLHLNSNDTMREYKPSILAALNAKTYGGPLPNGLYVFDFSDQGQPNYGGSRDYIDTEKLTLFEMRYNSPAAGTATIIGEQLARLT